jgi:NAD(P)-dependent dehydrogenase (short-subunit alcohol dehydrogenase family)
MGEVRRGLVTGAAQGIGEAVARHLVSKGGYAVALADIQAEKVNAVGAEIGQPAFAIDIASVESVRATCAVIADEFGPIDFLVNIAGIDAQFVSPIDLDDEHWNKIVGVNLTGTWNVIAAVLPGMVERRRGRIVNIASICGVVPTPGVSPAYVAAKAGVVGLTMSLATELEKQGVLVNAIAPGATGTTGHPMSDAEAADYRDAQALGFGGAAPIAHAVGYLLGSGGDWLSGVVMNVSGGFWRGR